MRGSSPVTNEVSLPNRPLFLFLCAFAAAFGGSLARRSSWDFPALGLAQGPEITGPPPAVRKFAIAASPIQFSQPVRRGKYIESGGRRAVVMGREEGIFESWIYPLKVVHDLRLTFNVEGYSYPIAAAELAEWITVRPESTTIAYSHPAFLVRATAFTPLEEPGSLILLDIDSNRRVSVTISFVIDLIPMWPGGLGGQYSYWDEQLKGFVLTESTRKHSAIVGSPAALRYSAQPAHNLPDAPTQLHIDVDPEYARQNFIPIAIAGGLDSPAKIRPLYIRLLAEAPALYEQKIKHLERIRSDFVSLHSPDPDLNRAVEWAKVALDAGFICNPQLGCGQVAGLGLSGASARPGFGWYFGGDTFINSFAVAAMGDFASLKQELRFLQARQREDGKMMHELSQAGAMIPWFTQFPYGYYHADTTPLYLVAMDNFFASSGDREFLQQSWDFLKKAYQYCLSTDADGDGMMDNSRAGLGAVETGKLLNRLATDIYLAGVSTEAHRAMHHLALALQQDQAAEEAKSNFDKARLNLNERFWNPDKKLLSFALTEGGGRSDEVTLWPAVPALFRLIRPDRASVMLDRLAGSSVSTDWGGRMLTNDSTLYDPISYNNGAVWPFLSGLLAWAEYRHHRPISGFLHWSQNAGLSSVHSLGFTPELLSGDFYQALDTAVPHQLFSSSGVLTPLVRGMLGFSPSAPEKTLRLEPHLPSRWEKLTVRNLRVGDGSMTVSAERKPEEAVYRLQSTDLGGYRLVLSPGFEPGAAVRRVTVNGKTAEFQVSTEEDTHCEVAFPLTGNDEVRFNLIPGLRLIEPEGKATPGERSAHVRIINLRWDASRGRYVVSLEGRSGRPYRLRVLIPRVPVSIDGAKSEGAGNERTLVVDFPPSPSEYSAITISITAVRP